jgi:nitroreductase
MDPMPVPPALSPEALVARLQWRYATKRFDPSFRIPAETWSALEAALVLAPSSYGLQPWHFVVVTDPAVRARLSEASWNQPQVRECSHLVVFALRTGLDIGHVARHVERIAALRAKPRESLAAYEKALLAHVARPAPFDIDEWSRRQVYLALGCFLTAAALLGVDACPMEGFEPARYDEILGLTAHGFAAVVVAAAGRRSSADAYASLAKVRFEPSELVSRV